MGYTLLLNKPLIMYEVKHPFIVSAPGVGTIIVNAVDKYHAIELAWSRNLDKQDNRMLYTAKRKR